MHYGKDFAGELAKIYQGRALHLKQAMAAIRDYEFGLSRAILKILKETSGLKIYGLTDANRPADRVPTFSFRLDKWSPRQTAAKLDQEGIYVWDGNYYALEVTKALGVEETGGMVRVGAVHYNTLEEIERFGKALAKIARS